MSRTVAILRQAKYVASRRLSPKAYWYVMGRLRPVAAVTSQYATVAECLASGEMIVSLLQRLDVIGPHVVALDIGAGLGRVEYHLHQRVARCYGIDVSPSMVRRARALVPFDNVEFVEGDGTGLAPWPDGFFDLVFSFLVFQHLPRAHFARYLAEAYAKLSPGGHFVFQLPVDERKATPDPPASHPYGLRFYTRREVEDRLAAEGFSQLRRTDLGGEADDGSRPSGDVVFCATKA